MEKKKYDPHIHHRRSIRLQDYDYSQSGLYFITICTRDRKNIFGEIENGIMILNEYGKITDNEWYKLPERFSNINTDIFLVMPNHIHGIIEIVGAPLAGALLMDAPYGQIDNNGAHGRAGASPAPTVGDIVGAYKSLVANRCLKIYKSKNEIMGQLWQRNYYEHIIRNEEDYYKISEYIVNNPGKWQEDKYFA